MSAKSRAGRFLGRTMRMPGVFDRKGARWALQALSPATVIVLVHRGRKSGRLYKTPVEVLHDDRERDELVVSPMFGRNSDWYRNVVAGGLIEIHVRALYSRMILRMLVRVNRFEGDPEEALLRELPMLGLRRADPARG